jgi:hypothetical protein
MKLNPESNESRESEPIHYNFGEDQGLKYYYFLIDNKYFSTDKYQFICLTYKTKT